LDFCSFRQEEGVHDDYPVNSPRPWMPGQ